MSRPGAVAQDLLYLSDVRTNMVEVFSYPSGALVQKLGGFGAPRSECADAGGDVWIADTQALQIDEYRHGGTKATTALSTQGTPSGCAVNPRNGDLAVAGGSRRVVLSIFHRSKIGKWRDAQLYTDESMRTGSFCGYDAQGDLLVDGHDSSGSFTLAELPRGAHSLKDLTVRQKIGAPGQIQWDGKYLAIGDAGADPAIVYRFSVSPSGVTRVGKTTLENGDRVRQSWIDGDRIVGPNVSAGVVIWSYPKGSQVKTFALHGYGSAVSKAR
jgi:hypothetical protein